MKTLKLVLLISALLFLSACQLKNNDLYPTTKYSIPLDKSCDHSVANQCSSNNKCQIRELTDVIDGNPLPWTCCPKNLEINPNLKIPTYQNDPCSWIIG